MKKRVFASHLLNDFSGSPRVLSQMLEVYCKNGYDVHLSTSSTRGHLSKLDGVSYHTYDYKWYKNKLLTLLNFFIAQIKVFTFFTKNVKKNDLVIINTLLPFGAGLASRLKGAEVIYYFHESYIRPKALFHFLFFFAKMCANKGVYVSHSLKDELPTNKLDSVIIHNALPPNFVRTQRNVRNEEVFSVFMACSLKPYKGVEVFIKLAERLSNINFVIVLNSDEEEVLSLKAQFKHQCNLNIYPKQADLHSFYNQSDLVLNLTDPKQCIESFGLTVLEGMSYGIPAIAPKVGGVTEIITDGVDGYLINPCDIEHISDVILNLSENKSSWERLSEHALTKSKTFSFLKMEQEFLKLIK